MTPTSDKPEPSDSLSEAVKALLRSLNIPEQSACEIKIGTKTTYSLGAQLPKVAQLDAMTEDIAPSEYGLQGAFILVDVEAGE